MLFTSVLRSSCSVIFEKFPTKPFCFLHGNFQENCLSGRSGQLVPLFVRNQYSCYLSEAATGKCSIRKVVRKSFSKFTEKHLHQSRVSILIKFLLKNRIYQSCFPANFAKHSKNT